MRPSELAREIAYPFSQPILLISMIVFFLLMKLVIAAGLLGLWLAVVLVPAIVRFLLSVAEARIYRVRIEPPGIEKFNWIGSAWSLMAILWMLVAAWVLTTSAPRFGVAVTVCIAAALLVVLPAALGMLALTRSPLASINPVALFTLIQVCGLRYGLLLVVIGSLVVLCYVAGHLGGPELVIEFAVVYIVFLLFTFTGAVVAESDAAQLTTNPVPEDPEPERLQAHLDRDRKSVLNHAYGLISRGNRDGGMLHLQSYIEHSTAPADQYAWFFAQMLRWEDHDPALFLAQRYFTLLLDRGAEVAALKLLARCLLENPRFRPAAADRERAMGLVTAHGRDDLRKLLQ